MTDKQVDDLNIASQELLITPNALKEELPLSDNARKWLERQEWPGNVRQLINAIERAKIMCEGQTIRAADLPPEVRQQREGNAAQVLTPVGMRVDAVHADTQNLGVGGAEAAQERFHGRDLAASSGGPVQRVEQQHDVALAPEALQGDGATELILELEVGGLLTDR